MKRVLSGLALVLFLGACAKPPMQSAQQDQIFPYETHVELLDNGLEVVLVKMSSGGLLAYWSIVRTGARDEYEPGHTGFAHFFEHMMFRGTEKFPQKVYSEITTKMGSDDNAFTSDDLTAYHLSVTSEDLEQVMEIESDRFKNLSYSKEAFETEAGAVFGEYRKNRMNPFFTVYEAIHKEAFDVHTYGHTAMGYKEDIEAMPGMYDYSLSFFKRYYRPDNILLFIVGELEFGPTMDLVRKYYGDWEPGYVPPQVPQEPEQTAEKRIDVPYEGQSLPVVWVAYKAGRFDPTDRVLVSGMLLAELAFGETSEIHKKLVLNEQVVEFIQADITPNRDPGLFDIVSRVKDPGQVGYVLDEIDRTVASFQETPPDPAQLDDLKSRLKYDFLMGLETPSGVARSVVRLVAVTGGLEAVDELYRSYELVTPADIQAAAQAYLTTNRRTIAVLRGEES